MADRTTRQMLHPALARPDLDRLFEAARNHTMTPAEREAQRRSWVVGEMMLTHPDMTREEAEQLYEEISK